MRFSHIKSHWIDRFKMEIKAIKFDHGKKKKKSNDHDYASSIEAKSFDSN